MLTTKNLVFKSKTESEIVKLAETLKRVSVLSSRVICTGKPGDKTLVAYGEPFNVMDAYWLFIPGNITTQALAEVLNAYNVVCKA